MIAAKDSIQASPLTQRAPVLPGNAEHVALVTCPGMPTGGADRELLEQALARQGVRLSCQVWSDPEVPWESFHALLPLYAWDYSNRPSSFRAWLAERESQGALIINDARSVRWCLDKAYLIGLQEQGVEMTDTQLRLAGAASSGVWPIGATVVVKPRLGAGSRGLQLQSAGEWRVSTQDRIVQLYEPAVAARGEVGVVCVEGVPLGCVRRVAAPGEFRVPEEWGGDVRDEPLSEAAYEAALRVLAAMPFQPTYCRLDFWDVREDRWLLAEVETFDPDLYLRRLDGAADTLAAAVARRLRGGVLAAD